MSPFFATLLSLHVILGVVGVMASFMVAFMLIRPDTQLSKLIRASWVSFLSYALSWFTGGWYYWKYYGAAAKDGYVFPRGRIVGGEYSWAHYIFTEAKEHVFIFLPFAALVLALILHYRGEALMGDAGLRKKVFELAIVIAVVGVIITLSGIIMSGAAR